MAFIVQRRRRDGADNLGERRITRANFQNLRGGKSARGFLECRALAVSAQRFSNPTRPFFLRRLRAFAACENSAQSARRFQEPPARRFSCHGYPLVRCYCNGVLRTAARL